MSWPSNSDTFAMHPHCVLVKGSTRGAIYDFHSGDVYSIDGTLVSILEACQGGRMLPEVVAEMPEVTEHQALSHLKRLVALGLGRLGGAKVREVGPTDETDAFSKARRELAFIWLELTDRCNLRCVHCYSNSSPSAAVRTEDTLTIPDWRRVLHQARELGCGEVQFIGGEPLLIGNEVVSLLREAHELGFQTIEIFTNATLISDHHIEAFKRYGVQVATTVYSRREEIHDRITGKKGSFRRTTDGVRRLQRNNVKVRPSTLVVKQNQHIVEETLAFLQELDPDIRSEAFDVVRPVGRGADPGVFPEKFKNLGLRKEPAFPRVSQRDYVRRLSGHGCWQGKICVKSDGTVVPCVMAREEICGNVRSQPLGEILHGQALEAFWGLSKDKVKSCKECEYRYACFDCRPQVKGHTGDLYAQPPECLYQPLVGEWRPTSGSASAVTANIGSESPQFRRVSFDEETLSTMELCTPCPCFPCCPSGMCQPMRRGGEDVRGVPQYQSSAL